MSSTMIALRSPERDNLILNRLYPGPTLDLKRVQEDWNKEAEIVRRTRPLDMFETSVQLDPRDPWARKLLHQNRMLKNPGFGATEPLLFTDMLNLLSIVVLRLGNLESQLPSGADPSQLMQEWAADRTRMDELSAKLWGAEADRVRLEEELGAAQADVKQRCAAARKDGYNEGRDELYLPFAHANEQKVQRLESSLQAVQRQLEECQRRSAAVVRSPGGVELDRLRAAAEQRAAEQLAAWTQAEEAKHAGELHAAMQEHSGLQARIGELEQAYAAIDQERLRLQALLGECAQSHNRLEFELSTDKQQHALRIVQLEAELEAMQARLAENHAAAENQGKEIRDSIGKELATIAYERDRLQEELTAQTNAAAQDRDTVVTLMDQTIHRLEVAFNAEKNQHHQLQVAVVSKEAELNKLREEHANLQQDMRNRTQNKLVYDEMRHKCDTLQEELATITGERDSLQRELAEQQDTAAAQAQEARHHGQYAEAMDEQHALDNLRVAQLEAQLEAHRQQAEEAITTLQRQSAECEAKADDAVVRQRHADELAEQCRQQLQTARAREIALDAEHAQDQEQITRLQVRLEDAAKIIEEQERLHGLAQENNTAQAREVATLHTRCEELQRGYQAQLADCLLQGMRAADAERLKLHAAEAEATAQMVDMRRQLTVVGTEAAADRHDLVLKAQTAADEQAKKMAELVGRNFRLTSQSARYEKEIARLNVALTAEREDNAQYGRHHKQLQTTISSEAEEKNITEWKNEQYRRMTENAHAKLVEQNLSIVTKLRDCETESAALRMQCEAAERRQRECEAETARLEAASNDTMRARALAVANHVNDTEQMRQALRSITVQSNNCSRELVALREEHRLLTEELVALKEEHEKIIGHSAFIQGRRLCDTTAIDDCQRERAAAVAQAAQSEQRAQGLSDELNTAMLKVRETEEQLNVAFHEKLAESGRRDLEEAAAAQERHDLRAELADVTERFQRAAHEAQRRETDAEREHGAAMRELTAQIRAAEQAEQGLRNELDNATRTIREQQEELTRLWQQVQDLGAQHAAAEQLVLNAESEQADAVEQSVQAAAEAEEVVRHLKSRFRVEKQGLQEELDDATRRIEELMRLREQAQAATVAQLVEQRGHDHRLHEEAVAKAAEEQRALREEFRQREADAEREHGVAVRALTAQVRAAKRTGEQELDDAMQTIQAYHAELVQLRQQVQDLGAEHAAATRLVLKVEGDLADARSAQEAAYRQRAADAKRAHKEAVRQLKSRFQVEKQGLQNDLDDATRTIEELREQAHAAAVAQLEQHEAVLQRAAEEAADTARAHEEAVQRLNRALQQERHDRESDAVEQLQASLQAAQAETTRVGERQRDATAQVLLRAQLERAAVENARLAADADDADRDRAVADRVEKLRLQLERAAELQRRAEADAEAARAQLERAKADNARLAEAVVRHQIQDGEGGQRARPTAAQLERLAAENANLRARLERAASAAEAGTTERQCPGGTDAATEDLERQLKTARTRIDVLEAECAAAAHEARVRRAIPPLKRAKPAADPPPPPPQPPHHHHHHPPRCTVQRSRPVFASIDAT